MTQPLPPPCCREADDGVCPQHEQQARVLRHQGIRVRSGGGHAVMGSSGRAREADPATAPRPAELEQR